MNFKLDYLIKRYTKCFNEDIFTIKEVNNEITCNLSAYNYLNDFELQHVLEKDFFNKKFNTLNCEKVDPKRVEIALNAYIISYSHISLLLNENVQIHPLNVITNVLLNFNAIKNNVLCELIAKDLTNLPPNYLTPKDFHLFIEKICQQFNITNEVKITAFDNEAIKANEFNLIDAIASSNDSDNFVLKLEYLNKKCDNVNHIFGKGVCYDAGGYSLKINNSMRTMKGDMGGASNTFGIFLANVINKGQSTNAYLGLVQNLITHPTLLPDQVIKTRDNVLVEITNTDSEGRLVIADLIAYANENIVKGDNLFVFATLTDIAKSMGRYVNTCFSNNLEFVNEISKVAKQNNEFIWPLPLNQFDNIYGQELEKSSQIATISNSNLQNLEANSIFAANFGYYFVKNKENNFIHFDIGSTGWRNNKGHAPLVRSITNFINFK